MSLQQESALVICQRALGLAEARGRFTSLEDLSDEAQEARRRYDQRRRTVLEALDWNFARQRLPGQPVAAAATPPGFPSAWAVPPSCLRIRGVWNELRLLRHKREAILFTEDAAAVQIVFTGDANDPTLFPPVFTQALEYLLAADFSMLYGRSANRQDLMLAQFRRAMVEADAAEAAERSEDPAYDRGGWVGAVEGGYGFVPIGEL